MGMYMVSYDLSHPDYNNEKVKETIQSYENSKRHGCNEGKG